MRIQLTDNVRTLALFKRNEEHCFFGSHTATFALISTVFRALNLLSLFLELQILFVLFRPLFFRSGCEFAVFLHFRNPVSELLPQLKSGLLNFLKPFGGFFVLKEVKRNAFAYFFDFEGLWLRFCRVLAAV